MKKILCMPSVFGAVLFATDLWASSAEHEGGFGRAVIWQIVAFVIVLAFLIYALKKPVLAFLAKRRQEISNALGEAKKRELEASRLLAEWEKKIESMTREIQELHNSIRQEGESERQKIIDRSVAEGERIRKQAQLIAEQEIKKAKDSLKKEIVDLSMQLADGLLKKSIQPQDQERLLREYIGRLKEIR
ncbi:MAG TPA: F0F1 ATP synthase subunit B [Thermodesulfobacteriota bacterium]|nr:F0F1 ATP synthase subunit B [Thermodesulfobacteriota bacterium]